MEFIYLSIAASVLLCLAKLSGLIRWRWLCVFSPVLAAVAIVVLIGMIAGRIEV